MPTTRFLPACVALPLVALACCGAGGGPAVDAGRDGAPPPPCTIVAPTACQEPAPRYADVEPIFQRRCVTCHYGAFNGPWPLTSYGHVTDWKDTIRDEVRTCGMPPQDSGMVVSNEERDAILMWLRCGLLR